MRKPLISLSCAFFLTQAAQAAAPIYLWDNQEGLIPAKSCEIIPVSDNKFRISQYSGRKQKQTENLRNHSGVRQSHLVNSSLLKLIDGQYKRHYKKIEVVGVNQDSKVNGHRWNSKRSDQGYLYKDSLLPLEDYLLEVEHKNLSEDSRKKLSGQDSSYWFIESQGNYYKLNCPDQEEKREYTLFRVYNDLNSTDPDSYVGVYWDETAIFKNIKTKEIAELENIETFEKVYDLDEVLASADNKIMHGYSTHVERVSEPEIEKEMSFLEKLLARFKQKPKTIPNIKRAPVVEDKTETENKDDKESSGQFENVICVGSNTLNVRNEELDKVLFKAKAGEKVKIFQNWDNSSHEKTINGKVYKFLKVQFADREEEDQQVGFVADNFVEAKSKCKFVRPDAPVNLPTDTQITGLDDAKCCEFPTVQTPTHSYTSGMRRFNARRGGGKRSHAACDLYRFKDEPILSIAPGTVVRDRYYFYQGTYALEVVHSGGFIARYGEITGKSVDGVVKGGKVKMGSRLGYMGKVNSNCCRPMLHFELFKGDKKGALSTSGNKFKRRSDLMDPTSYLQKWEASKF